LIIRSFFNKFYLQFLVLILRIFNMHAKTLLIVALAGLHMTAALPVFPSTDDKVDMAKGALQGANMVPSGYESTAKSFGRSYVAVSP
jgi:hypothetical protein